METIVSKFFKRHSLEGGVFYDDLSYEYFLNYIIYHSKKPEKLYRNKNTLLFKITSNKESLVSLFSALILGKNIVLINENITAGEIETLSKHIQIDGELSSDIQLSDSAQDQSFSDKSDQASLIFLSSGSTGEPKLIEHNLESIFQSAQQTVNYFNLSKNDSWFLNLPLNHVSGLMIIFRAIVGGFSISSNQDKCNLISLVPTQLYRKLKKTTEVEFLQKAKLVLIGGATVSKDLIWQCEQQNISITSSYGMTETCSHVAIMKNTDSSFIPLPTTNAIIKNQLLYIKTPCLAKAYWKNKVKKALPTENGFFKTSDLANIHDTGAFSLIGRSDNLFISGGENINPYEIEDALNSHPEIMSSKVIPFANKEFGHIAIAFLDFRDNPISKEELRSHLETKISKYKIPKKFYDFSKIPYNQDNQIKPSMVDLTKFTTEYPNDCL